MYWHGAQEDTKRTVNKIIGDRAKSILVVTGIACSPMHLRNSCSSTPRVYQCPPRDKHGVPRLSWLMVHSANPLVMKQSLGG